MQFDPAAVRHGNSLGIAYLPMLVIAAVTWPAISHAQPAAVAFSTFAGSDSYDSVSAITVDVDGYIYVAGYTFAENYPVTFSIGVNGGIDAMISKFSADGSRLIFSTRIGGSGHDRARDIAVDDIGNIYVVGETDSFDFPMVRSWQQQNRGDPNITSIANSEAFIVKLGPHGDHLEFATYFGGSGYDAAHGIALDHTRRVYITGETTSPDLDVTEQSLDGSCGTDGKCDSASALVGFDAFFAVFDFYSDRQLIYGTYLGGGNSDKAHDILFQEDTGIAYVTGETSSGDFPLRGSLQDHNAGKIDAFIAGIDYRIAGQEALVFSSYLGGSAEDLAVALASTPEGDLMVIGDTASRDFPLVHGFQKRLRGERDIFLARIATVGGYTITSTSYYGGGGDESAAGIAVNSTGVIYIAGNSSATDVPVWNADRAVPAAGNGFVAAFAADMYSLYYAQYYGGDADDMISSVASSSQGALIIAGDTESSALPQTGNAYQHTNSGAMDIFIAAMEPITDPATGSADRALPAETDHPRGTGILDVTSLLLVLLTFLGCRTRRSGKPWR